MLALPGGIFGSDLVAIDALHGQALVFLFCSELDKRGMHIIEGWRRQVGTWSGGLGRLVYLWGWALDRRSACGLQGQRGAIWQTWEGRRGGMYAIAYRGVGGMGDGRGAESIWGGDAFAGGRLRTRGIRMVLETRTCEEMLLLARSVLCTDLLAIDALHGHALVVLCEGVGTVSVTILVCCISIRR